MRASTRRGDRGVESTAKLDASKTVESKGDDRERQGGAGGVGAAAAGSAQAKPRVTFQSTAKAAAVFTRARVRAVGRSMDGPGQEEGEAETADTTARRRSSAGVVKQVSCCHVNCDAVSTMRLCCAVSCV